jgi:4-aminobutyrate aminotransferase/(S)-3-amino-2-methylpropionate transaminase
MEGVRRLCDEHGIVLVVDEVQTGFGRTGKMFAIEHSGVEPDLVIMAKAIAAGMPLSAVVGRAEVLDGPVAGGIGGTYPGNPVALASAAAVLDRFEDGELLSRSHEIGERIRSRFGELARSVDLIGEVRGLGAMSAIEFVRDRETKDPAREETAEIVRLAATRGVLILPAGVYGNCIRFLAPLVITDEQLDEALDILEGCVLEVARSGLGAPHGVDARALADPT